MVTYLSVENLTKSYGDLILFKNISFSIGEGERVGLIARNGAGKSTMLTTIASGDDLEGGVVSFRKDLRVAYLVQEPTFAKDQRVLEACLSGDSPILKVVADYERAVASGDGAQIERAIEAMDRVDAWDYESKVKQILTRLKITNYEAQIGQLSGGQLKRVALANALIVEPDLLILDEPTNHLDLEITRWLESYLTASKMALLMVTHDRYFLDRVCNRILEIDEKTIFSYRGNYSYYLEKREERKSAAAAQRATDQNLFKKELEWMRRQPQARATKAKSRIESFYELEDRLRREREQGKVRLDVKSTYIGKKIFEVKDLSKSYGEKCLLKEFSYTFSRFEKMGIVGENGAGKSTFLKMLMGEVTPDAGTIEIGQTIRFGYYSQGGIEFDGSTKVLDVVSNIAESIDLGDGRKLTASQFLQYFLFEPAVQHNYVSRLSGGERRRLYLCTILMQNPNFLILDEPTNDLDIMTLQVLEDYLQSFSGCLIVVSHDRYFMDRVVDHLMIFEGGGAIKDFPSSYSDYLVWRELKESETTTAQKRPASEESKRQHSSSSKRLSYKESRELEQIEKELPELEEEKRRVESELCSGVLNNDQLVKHSERVGELIELIDEKTMRWLELSER